MIRPAVSTTSGYACPEDGLRDLRGEKRVSVTDGYTIVDAVKQPGKLPRVGWGPDTVSMCYHGYLLCLCSCLLPPVSSHALSLSPLSSSLSLSPTCSFLAHLSCFRRDKPELLMAEMGLLEVDGRITFSKTVAGVSREGAGQGTGNAHPGLVWLKA